MKTIDWKALEIEFHKDLCGIQYSKRELITDDPDKVFNWFKTKIKALSTIREISDLERSKGRSENYYAMSFEQQWEEDKRLGILDWDGK